MATPVLTIGFAVFGQPIMLAEWFHRFAAAGGGQRDDVEVIVVDDCGEPPAVVPPGVRLIRVLENIPWAQGQARNIAAQEAKSPVLMMLDPDMTFPKSELIVGEVARFVHAAKNLPNRAVLRPRLRHGNGKLDSTSPNVYLIHREDFIDSKGYDLEYCGNKGWSDVTLSQVWARMFKQKANSDLILDFHHSGKFADAQVTSFDRSVEHNKKIHVKHKERMRKLGIPGFLKEHSPMVKSPWVELR